jgi:hypothetical protein
MWCRRRRRARSGRHGGGRSGRALGFAVPSAAGDGKRGEGQENERAGDTIIHRRQVCAASAAVKHQDSLQSARSNGRELGRARKGPRTARFLRSKTICQAVAHGRWRLRSSRGAPDGTLDSIEFAETLPGRRPSGRAFARARAASIQSSPGAPTTSSCTTPL